MTPRGLVQQDSYEGDPMTSPQLPAHPAPSFDALGDRGREALRASENRYRRLFETARDGIMLLNADTAQIEDVNPYLVERLGFSHQEFLGKKLWEVGAFADIAGSKEMFSELQSKGYVRYDDLPLKTRNGVKVEVEFISNSYECEGIKVIQCNIRDISERKAAESKIMRLAFYDPLTGLPNRRLLMDRLRQVLTSSTRSGNEGALLFIDLDDFKTLNDTLGHDMGDLLLQQVAHRLTTCLREGDTVARLGGDEFVVVLKDLSERSVDAASQVKVIGEKILLTLNRPYCLASLEHHSTASVGATLFGEYRNNIEDLLKQADIAMYQAKADGRNALRFFDPNVQTAVKAHAALEADLRQGIKEEQFVLYYQPQMDRESLVGAEALIRWQHPKRGLVSPLEFIPLAEEMGQILPLGSWVLETACIQMAAWAKQPNMAHLTMAVNVSARQFLQVDFAEEVLSVLKRTGADPEKLKLELTESMFLDNVQDVIAKMAVLNARGLRFSLDDFGTGYSSLAYLKHLPLSQLKIDRSFALHVLSDLKDATIARAIVTLGQGLGLTVIAEGIETEAQRMFFAKLGCHACQGYLFGRGMPANEFFEYSSR
jgi:diguanylate cyclase (GGDEF)-like protein/PAS domain S-box-containing protein